MATQNHFYDNLESQLGNHEISRSIAQGGFDAKTLGDAIILAAQISKDKLNLLVESPAVNSFSKMMNDDGAVVRSAIFTALESEILNAPKAEESRIDIATTIGKFDVLKEPEKYPDLAEKIDGLHKFVGGHEPASVTTEIDEAVSPQERTPEDGGRAKNSASQAQSL